MNFAAISSGIAKEIPDIKVINPTPFNALIDFPAIATITKGVIIIGIINCITVTNESASGLSPETCDNVTVGIPIEPNAVGVALEIRHTPAASNGSNPKA